MVEIPLTKNRVAIVDHSSVKKLKDFTWHFEGRYAATCIFVDGIMKKVYMHRLLAPSLTMIDHINENKLDNRLSNLRQTNKSKNALNKSSYSGAIHCKDKGKKQWNARIKVNGVSKSLGYYLTKEEASAVYKKYKSMVING